MLACFLVFKSSHVFGFVPLEQKQGVRSQKRDLLHYAELASVTETGEGTQPAQVTSDRAVIRGFTRGFGHIYVIERCRDTKAKMASRIPPQQKPY